ncbi:CmcI family methyltransferase [Anaerospora sp.]|uniref:cephalosporin hydroxylase family protein n=1 Tax=Anaerospora sp. TaxID=1960278 RepID=UPI002898F82C|nr:CmcI family methyltransferase [Anaerospora sp.]
MIIIDLENDLIKTESEQDQQIYPLNSPEAFAIISNAWLRAGWDTKYVYSFTWMGRPIIQLPEDMIRIQEVIYTLKPDVIIETGIAHGGSLIFYAGLCKMMDKGRVIGVDVEIRPHNRKAIESHPLFPYITLVEGNSIDPLIVEQVKKQIKPEDRVLVLLDSCHTKSHVLSELSAYAPLVSVESFIVATDGIMEQVVGAPRTNPEWSWSNPKQAALDFVAQNEDFVIEEPKFLFNEGIITERVTYWPGAFIKRIR